MEFKKEKPETLNEELSNILKQFSNKRDFVEIDGRDAQLSIGKVEDNGEFIEVEALAVCDKIALEYTMHKIANETGKEVKAVFGDEELVVKSENIGKEEKDSTERLANFVKQFYTKDGRVEVNGRRPALYIGEIEDTGEFIKIDTLGGCEKLALEDTMHKIADKIGKEVRAVFGDEELIVKPENVNENVDEEK